MYITQCIVSSAVFNLTREVSTSTAELSLFSLQNASCIVTACCENTNGFTTGNFNRHSQEQHLSSPWKQEVGGRKPKKTALPQVRGREDLPHIRSSRHRSNITGIITWAHSFTQNHQWSSSSELGENVTSPKYRVSVHNDYPCWYNSITSIFPHPILTVMSSVSLTASWSVVLIIGIVLYL